MKSTKLQEDLKDENDPKRKPTLKITTTSKIKLPFNPLIPAGKLIRTSPTPSGEFQKETWLKK